LGAEIANQDNLNSPDPRFGWGDGSGMVWNLGYPVAEDKDGNQYPLTSGQYRPFLTAMQAVWQSQGFVPTIDCGFKRDENDNFSYDCNLSTFIPTNWFNFTVWDHWYVDPAAGSDANAGTKAAPYKSLNKALTVAQTGATTGRVIWVQDGAVFKYGTAGTTGCWNGTAPVGNVVILPYSGLNGTTRWSTSMELENILTPWAQDLTADPTGKTYKQVYNYSPGAIYVNDYNRIDYQGLPYALLVNVTDAKTVSTTTGAGVLITVTTTASHGYSTGDTVTIASVVGNTAANGTWVITVTGATTFTLNTSVGNGAYVSGGSVTNPSLDARLVAATPNSCVSNGTTVWVNMQNAAGSSLTPATYVEATSAAIAKGTFVGRASTNVTRVKNDLTFVMARCDILGGAKPFGTSSSSNTAQTALTAFVDCTFKLPGRRLAVGADQNCFLYEEQADLYLLRCTALGGGKDGFNYKYARAVEIDCKSSWNGGYSTAKGDYFTSTAYGSNQGSTIHDNTRIIRFKSYYHNNNQNIYDAASAGTACSLNVDCYFHDSTGLDTVSKYNGDVGAECGGTLTIMIMVKPHYKNPTTGAVSTSTYQFIKNSVDAVDVYYEQTAPVTAKIRGTFNGTTSHLVTY
jgi:hypothetical protein